MTIREATLQDLHTAENIMYPLIAGVGIIANLVVITAITVWERLQANRTIANMFVVNLAIADLLFLAVLPLYMPILIDHGWTFGGFSCKFAEAIKYINFRASICFLTIMTVDRFFAIVYSLESRSYRIRKNGFRICLVVWIISLCLSIPVLIYADVYKDYEITERCQVRFPQFKTSSIDLYDEYDGDLMLLNYYYGSGNEQHHPDKDYIGYNISSSNKTELKNIIPDNFAKQSEEDGSTERNSVHSNMTDAKRFLCVDEGHLQSTAHIVWIVSNFVIFFLIPILTIIYCYGRIMHVTISRDVESTVANGVNAQLVKMVATLVSAFFICWFPFQLLELLILPPGLKTSGVQDCLILKSSFSLLAWTYSALNPFLYSFSSGRFRQKLKLTYEYILHGRTRVLAKQASQRTQLTRLHTTANSTKSLNVSSHSTKHQALATSGKNGNSIQTNTNPYVIKR